MQTGGMGREQPSREMRRALRQVQLYEHLVARNDRLYYPGDNHPLCSVQTAREMVRSGWMENRGAEYVITPDGLRVAESELSC